jgi:hypothetical protein
VEAVVHDVMHNSFLHNFERQGNFVDSNCSIDNKEYINNLPVSLADIQQQTFTLFQLNLYFE